MLIKCHECGLQVSDKAESCPHCGYPFRKRASKRKRLPNGFGQITELKNPNLRNKYRAMVTVGKDPNGRPICKILKPQGYFKTYNDAYNALIEYNKNPYDMDNDITIKELYDIWSVEHYKNKPLGSFRAVKAAWEFCSSIYDLRVKELRARHIKGCMEEGWKYNRKNEKTTPSPEMKKRIKSLFNTMLDYAVEMEMVDRNYSRTFSISAEIKSEIDENRKEHIAFTDEEFKILLSRSDEFYPMIIIIQCYSGWRPQELLNITLDNVDLENWTFKGGSKTIAGKNRVVPIHPAIRDKVKKIYEMSKSRGFDKLITNEKGPISYGTYKDNFISSMHRMGLNEEHRPHDCRKQFVTMCKKYNVDEYAIKKMVGHSISDITEAVYTTRDANWLHEEINKIDV